jgi:hypothetical protein
VSVIVDVIVGVPVVVDVHVNLISTVRVAGADSRTDRWARGTGAALAGDCSAVAVACSGRAHALSTRHRRSLPAATTTTVGFPCTCTATITGPITSTPTSTSTFEAAA